MARISTALDDRDFLWLAERIHECREMIAAHPRWSRKLAANLDNFIWWASVDGVCDGVVYQDAWVAAGQRLSPKEFERVPHTEEAGQAFAARDLKAIRREHIVPRAKLVEILSKTTHVTDTVRVLREYARVALVHKDETTDLKPSYAMPAGWDDNIDWTQPPAKLPSAWERFDKAGIKVHFATAIAVNGAELA